MEATLKTILFLSAFLICSAVPVFGASDPLGRVTVQLEDPGGHPVTNTVVRFAFMQGSKYERKTAVTDTNGLATAEAHALYYVVIATELNLNLRYMLNPNPGDRSTEFIFGQ